MENFTPFETPELKITSQAKTFLTEASKWTKFLSILGFVGVGFMVMAAVAMLIFGSSATMMSKSALPFGSTSLISIVYLLLSVVYFFPVYYLYKFSENTSQALRTNNTNILTNAFEFLKSHYKFMGILTIVILGFYALFFLFAIFGVLANIGH